MSRFFAPRPAPSDASAISALLAKDELARIDEKRERLARVLTKRRLELLAAIAKTMPRSSGR